MAREIDPEAIQEYKTLIQEQLDHLDTIIPRLKKGEVLGRLPAFGQLDASAGARTNYETFHSTTWDNLQNLRVSLSGMMETLQDSADQSDESDDAVIADMNSYESELGG
ncbi:hypothetical protein GCM10009853_091410 [Glycomyces scopariae]|uniref:PE family protein n=1 Tax=Glycomyces sambucus TaxID=380244 RepID=A0A1G9FIP5_9ACTN|nr:hypothetical protein [Glycomyces sambucus]SDK88202.1 hypothetical protein SAMN05216298_1817 [Glycomyces sambucus]